jgi:paraquat-inducible protein A
MLRSKVLLRLLLLIASALLVAGLVMPIITITQFMLFDNSFSVLSGVWQLFQQNHYLLFALVAAFSILLPLMKLWVLFRLLQTDKAHSRLRLKLLELMHHYGRWAMLDVMVVAMLIVSVKLGAIATIQVHPGLYVFGAAVLLIMLITQAVTQLTPRNKS